MCSKSWCPSTSNLDVALRGIAGALRRSPSEVPLRRTAARVCPKRMTTVKRAPEGAERVEPARAAARASEARFRRAGRRVARERRATAMLETRATAPATRAAATVTRVAVARAAADRASPSTAHQKAEPTAGKSATVAEQASIVACVPVTGRAKSTCASAGRAAFRTRCALTARRRSAASSATVAAEASNVPHAPEAPRAAVVGSNACAARRIARHSSTATTPRASNSTAGASAAGAAASSNVQQRAQTVWPAARMLRTSVPASAECELAHRTCDPLHG